MIQFVLSVVDIGLLIPYSSVLTSLMTNNSRAANNVASLETGCILEIEISDLMHRVSESVMCSREPPDLECHRL